MDAEIVAIGSELLLGTTIDTNSAYLAQQLAALGVNVFRKNTIGDNRQRIATAVNEALSRADLVICTGGLGPTVDDVTREGVADALDCPLEFHQTLLDQIAARFASFGRTMSSSNRRQAYIPQGARIISNPRGTAPAFLATDKRGTVIVLPGVPSEMRFLFETAIIPYLQNERGLCDVILVRMIHAVGLGESVIGERIADLMNASNPTVGISAKRARYELRLAAKADSHAAANALLDPVEATIRERLGTAVVGEEQLSQQIDRLLLEQNLTLALYEGHIRAPLYHALHDSNISRRHLLGMILHPQDDPVDETALETLAHAGAISVRDRWRSDLALATEVIDTPDEQGSSPFCLALLTPKGLTSAIHRYDLREKDGWEILGTLGLNMLRRYLLERASENNS